MADEWLVWQMIDSAFPAGSLAHSGGLEAAWQAGEVPDRTALVAFLRATFAQAARGAWVLSRLACESPGRFDELDSWSDAMLSNHVANRASRAQGQAYLGSVERVFRLPPVVVLRDRVRARNLPGHLAPAFGVVAAALGLSAESCVRMHAFVTSRGTIAAAVRLGVVGTLEGQSIQNELSPDVERAVRRSLALGPGDVAQPSPLVDLFQGMQDRLYSRLFIS